MRMYTLALIMLILVVILPDIFIYFKLKKSRFKLTWRILNFIPATFFIGSFIFLKISGRQIHDPGVFYFLIWVNFLFSVIYIPKILYLIFHFINFIFNIFLPRRTYCFRWVGAIAAISVILFMLHGAFINIRNFELKQIEIEVQNLPEGFDGFKIIQISDIHLGGWDQQHGYMTPAIDIINRQKADIIIFSGDMVNNFHQEMDGWQPYFNQLEAKNGKYAVLGNHDYGDYVDWKNTTERVANLNKIKQNIELFGFNLLLNENTQLKSKGDSILLVGVENWGKPPFPKYGNLSKALQNTNNEQLKLLISHDPSHWRAEITGKKDIFLMLAGHTHAAQTAFKIGGKMYSPSYWIYKEWDGLYQEGDQFLYINRGLGFIGFPMRMGAAKPEITLITLKKAKN